MPITFLDEEEDIAPLAPPTKRKITFLNEEDEETAPVISQPSPYKYDPARFRPRGASAPKAEQEVGTLEGIANAARNAFDSSRQALDIVGDVTPEEAKNIAKIEFEKQSRKVAPGYDEYQKAEGFDAVLAFAKNPIEVTSNIVAEGLAGSLPALGAGLAAGGVGAAAGSVVPIVGTGVGFTAGQVAGTFAGSLATEYGSKILEEMQEGGVDLTKPESIQGFFENEEAVAKARDKAISRGIPVAAFDAISAGIGGKLGRVIGKQFLTKTGEAAAELGVQAGLGGGGEVAGALVAGEPIEGKAVFGEIIGEAGPGAAEIITGRMADRAARVKAEEDAKIKAAAQLSDNLEQNSAPLTAAAVKSTTATTIEQDKLAAQLEEQLDADEIEKQVSGQLAVTKEPTAAPPAIQSKEEFAAIYSQVAPEELDAAEAGFTNTLATAATEEDRANAQNALEAIKEVKATVTPPAPTVEPTITPAVTPAVPAAQPPITDATQEIIQPEGVRQEPQDGVEGETPAETIARNRLLGAARGQEEGQVVQTPTAEEPLAVQPAAPVEPIISEIPPTSELVGAEPTQPTIREVPEISPIVGEESAAIVEQEPVAPAEEAPAVTPSVVELPTKEAIASVDKTESFNQELEQKRDFNPPTLPSLQDSRSVPDKVAKKGNTLSISGGSQEAIILNNEKAKKKFDEIGYERQEIVLPDDINEKVSSRYGASIAKIKSIFSPLWLGAHFHGGIAVSKDVKGTQRGRVVAHELGHASHSLLGDQINKDQEVLNELGKIEQILYPGLREKIQSSKNPDTRFFNYLLSADELIAEFNVERITNPEQAAQVAPKLTSLLESVEKDKRLVADRKAFPVILGAIRETKERLKVKGLEPREVKAGTMDALAGKYKQWSKTAKIVIDRTKSGKLEIAKVGLKNLKTVHEATKEFVKRTAELSGSPELMDYFNELYPTPSPTPVTTPPVTEAVTPAAVVTTPAAPEAAPPAARIESVGENKIYSPIEISEQDTGAYHFGDGGIASDTTMQRMGAGRGTGHYGTGTYFLGKKEADVQRADRPMLNINLAGLNMAKPGRSAIRFHDILRLFNKSVLQGEEIKFDQPADNGNRIFDLLDIALIGQVSGDRKARLKDAMLKVEGIFNSGTDDKLRTPSTYLMQELGFDGIDVRGTEADNTTYGSVVFAKPITPVTIPTVTEAVTPAPEAAPTPAGISVGNRIKLGKSPQTYTIEEVIPQSATERELGEQYYSVKNERTGETQVVEARDLKQVKGKGARKIAAATRNEEYMRLAQNPEANREQLQRMVDEAAKEAKAKFPQGDPSVISDKYWYHGRSIDPINVFDFKKSGINTNDGGGGVWLSNNINVAETYRTFISDKLPFYRQINIDELILELNKNNRWFATAKQDVRFAKTDDGSVYIKPIYNKEYEKIGVINDKKSIKDGLKKYDYLGYTAEDAIQKSFLFYDNPLIIDQGGKEKTEPWGNVVQEARKNGNDAVIFKNTVDTRGFFGKELGAKYFGDSIVVFSPEQIKSAEPVTYDDAGNIIPLEERFQPTSPDIRRQAIDTTPEGILITPPDQQYTFNEVFDVAYDMFGGEIPEGFTIVNDSKDKDFEFKAAYIPESGEIIVNLAYLNKSDDIRDTITHELGHYIFGDPEFRAAFDQFIASLSPEARADLDAYVETAYNKYTGEIRLEEKMVRAFVDQFINEEQAPAWRSMLDAIKRFLNKLGFKFNISDRDAISVFTAALDRYKAGEAISREGGARLMAAEPRREQVAGMEREEARYITTPEGIIKQTNDVLREKFFDGTTVSPEKTTEAWGYISRLLDIKSGAANEFAGQINDVVDQDTNSEARMGASLFSVSLANYAAKLAAQGDSKMLKYMIRNVNSMPTDKYAGGKSDAGRALRSAKEYDIDGYGAIKIEVKAKVERTAATLFGTGSPTEVQVKAVEGAIKESDAQELGNPEEVAQEVEKVEKRTKRKITDKIEKIIGKGSLKGIIQAIKETPLEKQQEAGWIEKVVNDFLVNAGLSPEVAATASKLYESLIAERLAEARQKAFEDNLNKSAPWKDYLSRNSRLAKDSLKKIQEAIRTGALDPEQNVESIIAAESGWSGFTKDQYQKIVQLDNIINDPKQDDVTRREAMADLNKVISNAKLPVRFKDALGAYYVGNALLGIPTLTVNIASPIGFTIRNLMTDVGKFAFTDPARIPVAFETFMESMRSWYDQTSYAFKNQIYLNDVVEYLQGQNVLRELFDKGKKQWSEGKYAEGFVNMAVGMTQITGRVLSSLDQGAISMLENQNITRYAMEALANTKGKVPKDKLKEFANMVIDTRRKTIAQSIANGMSRDRAGVLADLAVKSEVISALSQYDINPMNVLDASINDALQSVGRNKTLTIKGVEQSQQKISDSGFLSYLPIKMLENVAEASGREGSAMQIFAKMLYGFALVPARVFHNVAWFSPYGFIRLGIDKYKKNKGEDSPYAMSLQTEAQYRQRLTDSIAGSVAMLGLAALSSASTDEDEDKKFKIVITGNGPSATTDKQYFDSWMKKWKPYSVHIVVNGNIIPINIGRGGEALFFPIMLAGALDDWKIKQKQNLTKKEPEDLSAIAQMLGSSFFALAQRGPYAAFTKPLFDASKDGRVTEELASQAGFFGKTFIPVIGSSLSRNISDLFNDPVDRSSIEGAIYANTPVVGPWLGTKALNALGQPIRADDWGDKLYKLGVPVVFSFPKETPMNELNELILKQGSGPTIPTRANAQKRFGDVLTDKEFEAYVREYGKVMSDKMFKSRTKLANMKPADYDDELEKYARGYSIDGIKIKGASDSAVLAVKRMRQ